MPVARAAACYRESKRHVASGDGAHSGPRGLTQVDGRGDIVDGLRNARELTVSSVDQGLVILGQRHDALAAVGHGDNGGRGLSVGSTGDCRRHRVGLVGHADGDYKSTCAVVGLLKYLLAAGLAGGVHV